MSCEEIIRRRGITEALHFTTNRGLLGILYSNEIKSRARLSADKTLEYIFKPNSALRKDPGWLDYVNFSISRINRNFFQISSGSWHTEENIWWCILSFKPEILNHPNVFFATTNNIYSGVQRRQGKEGLESLFSKTIVQWSKKFVQRDGSLPASYPTCEQAEALYLGKVSTEFLQRIYVACDEDEDQIQAQINATHHADIQIIVNRHMFAGIPK